MNIEVEYDIGDEVWVIVSEEFRSEPCTGCDGGTITLRNGNKYRCLECAGSNKSASMRWVTLPEAVVVKFLDVWVDENGKTTNYTVFIPEHLRNFNRYMDSDTHYFDESLVFSTKEEAQIECDKKNHSGIV